MAFLHVIWDLDDDPDGNVQHIAEHDITKAEVLEVLDHPEVAKRADRAAARLPSVRRARSDYPCRL